MDSANNDNDAHDKSEANDEAHDKSEAHDEAHDQLYKKLSETELQILELCITPKKTSDLLNLLGYSSRTGNFKSALRHLLKNNLIQMTIPESPRSKKQKYEISHKGKKYLHFKSKSQIPNKT
ncbi:transcriptional regulator [Candidatus Magnetomorum sp. HK-1]|nr:transcriptional regulator [Candidatus Magnetomorum sp. HK-1]